MNEVVGHATDLLRLVCVAGVIRVRDGDDVIFEHQVEAGDVFRMCQVRCVLLFRSLIDGHCANLPLFFVLTP